MGVNLGHLGENYLSLLNPLDAQRMGYISHFDREATQKAILQQQQMLLNSNSLYRSHLPNSRPNERIVQENHK